MKITQWVPTNIPPNWRVINAWMVARKPENLPEGCTELVFLRSETERDEQLRSWNNAVEDFLKSDSEWLWSTHNDVVVDPKALIRLMSWNQPFVSGLVFMRQSPVLPHVWSSYDKQEDKQFVLRIKDVYDWFMKHMDWIKSGPFVMEPRPEDALVEIGFTSTSCTLIHRSVLEKIEKPWFRQHGYGVGGEDFYFFNKLRDAGFRGYMDRSCVSEHICTDVGPSSIDFVMWYQDSQYMNTGQKNVISSAS